MNFFSMKPVIKLDKFRYEIKIPMELCQLLEFQHHLRQLGLHFIKPYPSRQINSVYFDTHELDDYVENVSGISNRMKTRVRWYNNDIQKLALEFKIKKNKASYKQVIKIKNSDMYNPRTRSGILSINQNIKKSIESLALSTKKPKIEVQYERDYYLLGKDLRLTIDTNQKFCKLSPYPSNNFIKSPVYGVAEFKYPANMQSLVQSILRDIPFRVFRHSKYVIGIDTVYS
jgi:hypothetical protein